MIGRRGQGAMEYLMTYGWAILVVMVVGIVMWQLGIFNLGGVTSTTSTGFPRIKPQLSLMTVNSTGYFKGTFTNGAGGPVKFVRVSAKSAGSDCTGGDFGSTPNTVLSLGNNVELSGQCNGASGSTGDPYDITFTIKYNVTLAGKTAEHTDTGGVRGPIE